MIKDRQLHETDCGNCKHWKPWSDEKQKEYWSNHKFLTKEWKPGDLRLGDCDQRQDATPLDSLTKWSFGIFEDECYDEDLHCFEGRSVKWNENI